MGLWETVPLEEKSATGKETFKVKLAEVGGKWLVTR